MMKLFLRNKLKELAKQASSLIEIPADLVDKANELLQDLASNILIDPNNKAEPFW